MNVTLNERCNHQNNQTTVSLLKTITKLLPVHSETGTPKDLCAERKEFPLRASNKRVNVCSYQDRIRVDVSEFLMTGQQLKASTSHRGSSYHSTVPFLLLDTKYNVKWRFCGMLEIVHILSSFRVTII